MWMSTCIVLVFAAILEFAVVNTLARKEIRRMSIRAKRNQRDDSNGAGMCSDYSMVSIVMVLS